MVDVDTQNQVRRVGGQFGIGFLAKNEVDIAYASFLGASPNQIEHFWLNIDCHDLTFGSNLVRETECEVAAAGANVGDDMAGFELKDVHELCRQFFTLAFGPVKPFGREMAHYLRDLTA